MVAGAEWLIAKHSAIDGCAHVTTVGNNLVLDKTTRQSLQMKLSPVGTNRTSIVDQPVVILDTSIVFSRVNSNNTPFSTSFRKVHHLRSLDLQAGRYLPA
jgi:hypothetical protein